jgi:Flp pilus assembly protein CpaB
MRKTFLILGAVLGVIVAVGIFLYFQISRPTVVEVPVALNDIPAGTVLKAGFFRVTRLSNVDSQTVAKWITVAEWNKVDGKVTTSDIRSGFPIAKAQIDPNSSSAQESRLSVVLTGTNDYYIVIATKPDEVGNYVQPGDRVDLIINIGGADRVDKLSLGPQETGDVVDHAEAVTQTIPLPISKLVMQNMSVLRVDRAPVQRSTTSSTASSTQAQAAQQDTASPTTSDVKRLYVKVDRAQLEVLSFVLNNGKRNIVVRAANGSKESLPSDGVTWDDFVRWFFAQRGNQYNGAQPFDAISPSTPITDTNR